MPEPALGAEKLTPEQKGKITITPKDKERKLDSLGRPLDGRGRPKGAGKKPPRLTWSDFEKDALAKACDELLKDFVNGMVLKDRTQKLDETKVGSALLYSVYYYTDFKPDHPIMVLMIAGLATGNRIRKCLKSPKTQKSIEEAKKKAEEKAKAEKAKAEKEKVET